MKITVHLVVCDDEGECLILGGARRHLLRSRTEPRIPLPECRLPISI